MVLRYPLSRYPRMPRIIGNHHLPLACFQPVVVIEDCTVDSKACKWEKRVLCFNHFAQARFGEEAHLAIC